LGGYEPVEFKERGDLRVQHDGDTGSTIIERLDPVDGKWKPEEGLAYRDFASETGGEARFVVNDEVLTASTGGRPIHEPGKDDYVDITPYPNREDHDTTTPPYPMAEQDKDSHIQSNPLPGEKLPWRTETPADRVDEPTVMLNEKQDSGSIQGSDIESDHVSGPDGSKMQVRDVGPNKLEPKFSFDITDSDISRIGSIKEELLTTTQGVAGFNSKFRSKVRDDAKAIGFADIDIDGKQFSLKGFSSERDLDGFVPLLPEAQRQLPTTFVNKSDRFVDVEPKILEQVLLNTTKNSTGKVRLVVDRDLCTSCAGTTIPAFNDFRPNVQLEIIQGPIRSLK
jgi:hypothetical protein